ncbi:hypothetical protein D3C80_1918490 [compost metagenome]
MAIFIPRQLGLKPGVKQAIIQFGRAQQAKAAYDEIILGKPELVPSSNALARVREPRCAQ